MQHTFELLEARRLLSATGAISGSVYTDLNANAKHEAGEAGLKNVRVYLDANNNGKWDSKTETSALTDKRGQFKFDGLAAGTYRLREVSPNNTVLTAPRSSWFKIRLADGQHVARRQFANAPVQRSGGSASGGTTSTSVIPFSGDSDLVGVVNFDDYARVDTGFSRTGWFNGDFDYNGIVNFDDYDLIDQAFNTPGAIVLNPTTPPTTPAPQIVTAKEQASIDVSLNRKNRTLAAALSWLSGNKNVARSAGVQAAIDGYQKFGLDYKREFLKIGNS